MCCIKAKTVGNGDLWTECIVGGQGVVQLGGPGPGFAQGGPTKVGALLVYSRKIQQNRYFENTVEKRRK